MSHLIYCADWAGATPDAGSGYGVAAHLMCAAAQAAGLRVTALGVDGLPPAQNTLPTGVEPHRGPQEAGSRLGVHSLPHAAPIKLLRLFTKKPKSSLTSFVRRSKCPIASLFVGFPMAEPFAAMRTTTR